MALTIRIDGNFKERLDELKIQLGIKTGTGVIRHVVGTYDLMAEELTGTKRELIMVKKQLDFLVAICQRKDAIEQELSEFLKNIE